jgi:uncharacterized protein
MLNRNSWLVLLTTFALANPASAASFDCSKAASKIEKMICQDEELSRLDGQLGEKFNAAARLSTQPDQLKNAQRSWLRDRRNPCTDKPCLVAAYQLRMQELDKANNLVSPGNHPVDTATSATSANPPPETDNARTQTHDEVLDGQWVTQKAKTERCSFRVAITGSTEDSGSSVTATAIQVIDRKTGKILQTINAVSSDETATPPEQLLQVVDANFDHHPDITLFGQSGGAGPNNTDNYFLFNPPLGQFEFNELLSDLPQIQTALMAG